jgi:hypothetical protein
VLARNFRHLFDTSCNLRLITGESGRPLRRLGQRQELRKCEFRQRAARAQILHVARYHDCYLSGVLIRH